MSGGPWLSDDDPLEPEQHAAQLAGLRDLCAPGMRLLDLGCGAGRVARPLIDHGCLVTGVDQREEALEICRRHPGASSSSFLRGDFLDDSAVPAGPFDAALCLGNTLMLLVDPLEAVRLFEFVARRLTPNGVLFVDDIPGDFWPELSEGNWAEGVAEGDALQIAWESRDAVFALRSGDDVRLGEPIGASETRYRLWTDGLLRLTAHTAGLSELRRFPKTHLLRLSRG